jgi:hypothetical protein
MLVYFDTNVVVRHPYMAGAKWEALAVAASEGRLELATSELTIREAAGRFRASHSVKQAMIRKMMRTSSKTIKAALLVGIEALESESKGYELALAGRMKTLGVTILPLPDADHAELTQRAIDRRPPFDAKGGGYRDALHWFTFLERLRDEVTFPSALFISGDQAAFGEQAASSLLTELDDPDFEWFDHEVDVTFSAAIDQIDIPNQYVEDEPDYDARAISNAIAAELRYTDLSDALNRAGERADVARVSEVAEVVLSTVTAREEYATQFVDLAFYGTAEVVVILEEVYQDENDEVEQVLTSDPQGWFVHFKGAIRLPEWDAEIDELDQFNVTDATFTGGQDLIEYLS